MSEFVVNVHAEIAVKVAAGEVETPATVKENAVPPGAAQISMLHELRLPYWSEPQVFAPLKITSVDGE